MNGANTENLAGAEALAHPLALARALIRCESVTPADGGALDVLQEALQTLGFTCHRLPFEEPGTAPVDNLYARRGEGRPNFCFAGTPTWCRRAIAEAGPASPSRRKWRTACSTGAARAT